MFSSSFLGSVWPLLEPCCSASSGTRNLPTASGKQKLCCIQDLQNSSGPGFQMSSGIMQLSLGICLLATCIALGVSLECEECFGMGLGINCHGNIITCSANKDTCAIISAENMGQSGIMKMCMSSENCGHGLTSLNMGSAGVVRTNIICCIGNECKRDPAPLPPRNTTLNGKKCPACYAVGSECKDEITECVGDENFCYAMSGTTSIGKVNTTVSLKGCANEASCYEIKNSDASLAGIGVISEVRCTGGATASTSEIFGLLYPLLAGVLFMKFFV
ncbi:phospholipase A2 inhibitor gamma subunit B-like isoform X2 [Sceloporus undulatus]|uniref:phospholipase A2 inhibitor gamma subunit B-like isoform X2 n=1 Tax=Sceloporus undulatus TaxID=8520 RepID=UPI001C4DAEBE|nr:phospholipase A2 inhibitor gamma subunit B-like isoform X2 [Sceloporus undulatus]